MTSPLTEYLITGSGARHAPTSIWDSSISCPVPPDREGERGVRALHPGDVNVHAPKPVQAGQRGHGRRRGVDRRDVLVEPAPDLDGR
jgi:hypothetical protein